MGNNNVFTNHTQITLGFLRNGAANDVARTARDYSLAAKYHYSSIRYAAALAGNEATRDPACPDIVIFEANAREAFHTIVEAAVADAYAAHAAAAGANAGAAPFDEDAARTAAAASAPNRLEAIAIGAVRTSLARSYRIV